MKNHACTFAGLLALVTLLPSLANAQTQQSRGATEAVSQDLLAIYAKTKSAASESDVTAIARQCASVVSDTARSRADRKYASSLFAWALNRRGEIRNDRAAELVDAGKLNEAKRLDMAAAEDYATAIQHGPPSWRTHHNYAISLAMQGDYKSAIEQFTESINLKPSYANANFNRGELYFEMGEYDQAIADYNRAIDLDATDPQFFNSRGHCYFLKELYSRAIEDYQLATEIGTDTASYQIDLADAHQFLGNWQEAAEGYRAAVAIDNADPRAFQNAAWLMATCPDAKYRKPDLALSAAKKAIALEGRQNARLLDTLAAAYAASGNFAQAKRVQDEALKLADAADREELTLRAKYYAQRKPFRQPGTQVARNAPADDAPIRTASGARPQRKQ
ncbi:MAG: hypothetical protein Aurels2KO_46400 [Aureliella sp.]